MIRFSTNRIWKGEPVQRGDEVVGSEKEKQALLDCGQAYNDSNNVPTMDNTKDEIIAHLEEQDINFNSSDTKAELLDLC